MNKKQASNNYDIIIVGAGFAGLYALYKFRSLNFKSIIVEKSSSIGGTWFWNSYPGARCDVESIQYSYQFSSDLQKEWNWKEKYASQKEILNYAKYVTKKFDLKKNIIFNSTIKKANYDEKTKRWKLNTNKKRIFFSNFLIMATGPLSKTYTPTILKKNNFKGKIIHTGEWAKERISFKGKNVGVIGTGSSAIQAIPIIAKKAKNLYVFQRTPHYSVPANNIEYKNIKLLTNSRKRIPKGFDNDLTINQIKKNYASVRSRANKTFTAMLYEINQKSALEKTYKKNLSTFEKHWKKGGIPFLASFKDITTNPSANKLAAKFVKNKISKIVKDKNTAKLLTPKYPLGCKRLAVDSGYYETFNRKNVFLIDIEKNKIKKLLTNKLKLSKNDYNLDVIILGTGFDAITGPLLDINIVGKNRLKLREKWKKKTRSFLGISISGFPNMFTINGPFSPSVLSNMIVSIEQQVNWIANCLQYMETKNYKEIEICSSAEKNWVKYCKSLAKGSLYYGCKSWYRGTNIKNKPLEILPFLGGFPKYNSKCATVEHNKYKEYKFK